MDPQTLLLGLVVFVMSAFIIYIVSVFGTKEKSFEEAIAEQKKRMEDEKEKQRSEKRAEKEKKKSRKGKEKSKEKEKPAQVYEPELKEHKMVNLEIDPVIIEPLTTAPEKKSSKSKKNEKIKPILVNKDEKPAVSSEAKVITHRVSPKDEVELKHDHDIREVKEKKSSNKSAKTVGEKSKIQKDISQIEEEIIVEKQIKVQSAAPLQKTAAPLQKSAAPLQKSAAPIQKTAAPLQKSATPPQTEFEERRSNKHDKGLTDSASQLFTEVRGANLSDKQVQTLIDILLDKHGAGSSSLTMEWNKKSQKGDPVALLRKQLEEKERALQEEQQMAMTANNKCKELKNKITEDKARYVSMEKQYQDKITGQNQEIQALHSRMQSAHDSHLIESSNLQATLQQLQQTVGDGGRLHKLVEENKVLKENLERTKAEAVPHAEFNSLRQKVSIMENELSNNVIKLNASEKSRKNLETKIARYEEEIKKLKSDEKGSENTMTKRVDEVSQQLRKAESEKATVTSSLKAAEKECMSVKNRLKELEKTLTGNDSTSKELEERLKGSEKELATLKTNLKTAEKKLTDTETKKSELQNELQILKKENQSLSIEVKTARERHVGEGQERGKAVGAPNGVMNTDKTDETVPVKEHEKLKSDIVSSQEEIESLKSEIATYKMDLIRAEAEVNNYKVEVSNIQEELEKQKKKNNELREKNWKAMDALEKAEKSASDKVQTTVKGVKDDAAKGLAELEKYDKAMLKKLLPNVSVSDKLAHKDWMSSFEKNASVYITSLSKKAESSASSSEAKLKELQDNNNQLQSQLTEQKSSNNKLETQLSEHKSSYTKLQTQLQESQNKSIQTETKHNELQASNSQLQSQLETQKKLSLKGSETEKKVKELQDSNNRLQSELNECKNKLSSSVSSSDNKVKQLEENISKLQTELKNSSSSSSRVEELEEINNKLTSQLDEFRNVLATTESKLQQLENSVEGEEKKWQEKLQASQLDLEQSRQEVYILKQELQKMGVSSEMKDKVSTLETQLKISEEKASQLEKETIEKTESISTMQLKVIEVQKFSQDNEDLLKQIAELKTTLEGEKKNSKELASKNVKLHGIIKTGHDALTQEQDVVEKLKKQLQGNGKDTGSQVQGLEELKAKLADTEKQLEKEMTNNKQLSQRLTSPKSKDTGTSV